MVKILYTKAFLSQYKKQPETIRRKAESAIKKFKANPYHPSLSTHKLSGELTGFLSFSVDYKTTIIFEAGNESSTYIFLKIGSHDIYR